MSDQKGTDTNGPAVPGWIRAEMRNQFPGASILLVEDDGDIRELMATLLRLAGFEPTVCSSAEMALEQLREQPFDLVLTDYALPNKTGRWLLECAQAEGLIDATPVLVVTAHPDPEGVGEYEVVPKPFDLDDLVDRIKQRLEGTPRRRKPTLAAKPSLPDGDGNDGNGECPEPVELILYVSADSPKSAAAIANIRRAIARFRQNRVKLTICDLSRNPTAGAADSIAFTPTLVKRSPGPRTYILGHVTNPDVVVDLLYSCADDMS